MKTTAPNAATRTAGVESADYVLDAVITRAAYAELAEALDAALDENQRLSSCIELLTALANPIDRRASDSGTFDVTDYLVAQELIVAALA